MIRFVQDYIDDFEKGRILLNRERIDLFLYIDREIIPRLEKGELFFDEKQIENCIKFIEKSSVMIYNR